MPVLKSYQPWCENKDRQICKSLAKNKSTLASEWKQFQHTVRRGDFVKPGGNSGRSACCLQLEGWGDGAKLFPEAHSGRQAGSGISHTLQWETLAWYRDKSVATGGMQHGETLSREGEGSPSLETSRLAWLNKHLSNMLSLWKCPCREWNAAWDKLHTSFFSLVPGCYLCYFWLKWLWQVTSLCFSLLPYVHIRNSILLTGSLCPSFLLTFFHSKLCLKEYKP